jgi:hypothetical protein
MKHLVFSLQPISQYSAHYTVHQMPSKVPGIVQKMAEELDSIFHSKTEKYARKTLTNIKPESKNRRISLKGASKRGNSSNIYKLH